MEMKLIAGAHDEQMIELAKSTIGNYSSEEHSTRVMNSKAEIRDIPHEVGSCRNCRRWNKFDCALMKLCRQYGHDKVYDAVFYAYGGDSRILEEIEAFTWETMTEEQYGMHLEWLSGGKVMAS